MTEISKPLAVGREPSGAVYDGRQLLGYIFDAVDGTIATLPDRVPLGTFKDWREARTAIHEASHREFAA